MCGIFVSLSATAPPAKPNADISELLRRRGPDSVEDHVVTIPNENFTLYAYFLTTVLSLRGSDIVAQPLVDRASGSVLCWNGEAWSIRDEIVAESDTTKVFQSLLAASLANARARATTDDHNDAILGVLSSVRGPYALVFYDAASGRLYFGRDCLGRRSLLYCSDTVGEITISSLTDSQFSGRFHEVEADGLRVIDLSRPSKEFVINRIPYDHKSDSPQKLPFGPLNKAHPTADQTLSALTIASAPVHDLERVLRQSLSLRVQKIKAGPSVEADTGQCILAILFSGGLDCSVIARMTHDLLDESEPVDLLNVAFHNPRTHKPAEPGQELTKTSYELCPDRLTGRKTFAELQRVCPSRTWRFVAINIPYEDTLSHRELVKKLMQPHNTEMDLSISYALYFASRGIGTAYNSNGSVIQDYSTSARVLLSGLGADELFGGYQRHATAYSRSGFPGLLDELELDVNRLGKRNLGRDDRVISHWGKEARFPYLDEDVMSWALSAPIWQKCGFGLPESPSSEDQALEPGKLVLRLLAARLGMTGVASEKKRAVGSTCCWIKDKADQADSIRCKDGEDGEQQKQRHPCAVMKATQLCKCPYVS
ncbi:hypothetical protein EJ05DRAFT_505777 [Pseudovirgaria hyperparasitica]|uniref:Glutamine amidotransferase type-2 domain-containing protein n=1 Tax=Pseudovirgaria hyperparasitica TaxID=470096 RepID=A0A6A6VS78_9PEZI|nr:uncharacterized protein EJ05DRAFT_505777 [Pseudovirgaria hyperparasitica]KAF2752729.1 hypothetical protein EJ05DRAFT_505777 [Pseudovirgaria hyperparasitica]